MSHVEKHLRQDVTLKCEAGSPHTFRTLAALPEDVTPTAAQLLVKDRPERGLPNTLVDVSGEIDDTPTEPADGERTWTVDYALTAAQTRSIGAERRDFRARVTVNDEPHAHAAGTLRCSVEELED